MIPALPAPVLSGRAPRNHWCRPMLTVRDSIGKNCYADEQRAARLTLSFSAGNSPLWIHMGNTKTALVYKLSSRPVHHDE